MKRILKFINLVIRYPFFFISDKAYLKRKYRKKMGRELNLENPVLFSEKLQWLKLYDRNPIYHSFVDKAEVRKIIAEKIGEEYLIPSLGVWDSFDEINFDKLPEQFVLKCTHDAGSTFVCKDKKAIDMKKLRKHFNKFLLRDYYWCYRQWVYKNIKPRIIAEKFMVDESGTELKDYKILCFNGEPKFIDFIYDRFSETGSKEFFYTPDWERLKIINGNHVPDNSLVIPKPKSLDKMLELARILSAGMAHVRVDFYLIYDKIYFGELTFYTAGGYEQFKPSHWDKTLGGWLTLPLKR